MIYLIKFLFLVCTTYCIYHCMKDLSLVVRRPSYRNVCPIIVPILYMVAMFGLMIWTVRF